MADKRSQRVKKVVGKANDLVKGNKMYHGTQGYKYRIDFDTSTATKVNVIDKTLTSPRRLAKGKVGGGDWVFRLDGPHRGANFDHININPNISGHPDPHIKLPAGGLKAGKEVAKFCKTVNKVNKVAVPLALAVDTIQTGMAIYDDAQNDTTRNTVEQVATTAGAWGGGYGGAVGGAALGSAIFPGVGTIIGGICGALVGGFAGSEATRAVTEAVADECDYDIEWRYCDNCDKMFKARLYRGERYRKLCDKCN